MTADEIFENAIETARRLGLITYVDESVRFLPKRESLAITDIELPDNPVPKEAP